MIVGDLLVLIGIKGAAKVGETLTGIGKGLHEVSNVSLETKAAILGAFYAVEHFMSASAKMGMTLKQFSNYTQISTGELQKWQYAARQAGVPAEEVQSSIEGVHSAIAKIQMNKGPVGGFAPIAMFTKGFDFKKAATDTLYVLKKVKEFAQNSAVPLPFANEWMQEAGFSKNMIQFLRTTKIDLEKIRPTEIFSDREINQLAKINVSWSNLHRTFEMLSGHMTAKYGSEIVNSLSNALKFVADLTENIIALTKAFPPLKDAFIATAAAFAIAFAPVTATLTAIIGLLNEIQKFRTGKDSIFGEKGNLPAPLKLGEKVMQYVTGNEIGKDLGNLWDKFQDKAPVSEPKYGGPMPQGVTVNQNITHYGDAKDTKGVKDLHGSALRQQFEHIYNTSPAVLQYN